MKNTFRNRMRYTFDNFMSKGTIALILGLSVVTIIIILLAAFLVHIFAIAQPGTGKMGFLEAFWQSLMRTLDAGNLAGDEGWELRLVMFIVTLGGIFILSALIGVLNTGLNTKLYELRKGRSLVIEKNHTVILGWSAKIFTILSELIEANSNHKNCRIVILGDKEKLEMEEAIHDKIKNFGTTKIICRSGRPIIMNDLKMVNLHDARSIIVLAPEKKDPDSEVIKTVLAITNDPGRATNKYHIVAEINDFKNADVCRMVGKDEIEIVLSTEIISKITAQTCRQSGLSAVYMELLVYEGDELYFQKQPELIGKTYGEALFAYDDSSLFGLYTALGETLINPLMNTVIGPDDEVICISQDDDTVILNGRPFEIQEKYIQKTSSHNLKKENTLILGWNSRGSLIIKELDSYVKKGSQITIAANVKKLDQQTQTEIESLCNCSLNIVICDTTNRKALETLNLTSFDHIILLSYAGLMSPEESDSATLITLLHLRDIAEKTGVEMSIVSEMLIDDNRILAEVTNADDFIVSEKVISLLLTQISEKKELAHVFNNLFSPEGSEVYLKPVTNYITAGIETNFYTLVEAARRQNETAIGYRLIKYKHDSARKYGVTINPKKSNRIVFDENDKIIVLAEN